MHQKRPFLTRKGDDGFNPTQAHASKGDTGFKQPGRLVDRAWPRGTSGLRGAVPKGLVGLAAAPVGGGGAWPGFEPTRSAMHSDPAPLVWRAPEGPEGTGGLRGAAPNEVRPPSLAGGRALRRPEHQRRHTATTRRSDGGPPPTGAQSSPARQRIQKRPPGTGWVYLSRLWESNPRPIHYE